ncbi:unnamed protein product [Rotaria sordida]|nr:unnamed protein product [Rotaria sordida]CAF0841482.1 unnamed protein product [Rotaria sordida]CAF0853529.1 unnamed protein product [Rotaria sordida]CAF0899685.1 unnamed protein product [Rotaria sordida]CAF3649319.1 unnamed protein product [Rotaria sordida]
MIYHGIKNTISSHRRRYGLMNKIGTGFRRVFRRFGRSSKLLSEMEIQILLSITNFTREEILQWHEKFLADCPHGYMTRKEFILMYKSLCPTDDAERFAGHIFRAFDIDKSNTIDFREFLIGLSMTSTTSSPQTKLRWIFQVFDIDGNGLLTRKECLEVIDIIVRFNQTQLTDEEDHETERLVHSAKRSMMKIFDNISGDRCNALTMTQFIEGCQKDEFISKLLTPTPESENGSTIIQNTENIPIVNE